MPHRGHHKDCDLALEPSTKTSSQVAERFSVGHWCLFWSDWRAARQQGVDRFFVKDSLDWKEIEEFVQSTTKNNQ